jgi:hypothetical protein
VVGDRDGTVSTGAAAAGNGDPRRRLGSLLRSERRRVRPATESLQRWAQEISFSRDYVSGVETGHHWPSRQFVEAYEDKLGLAPGTLVSTYLELDGARNGRVGGAGGPPRARGRSRRIALAALAGTVVLSAGAAVLAAVGDGEEGASAAFTRPEAGSPACYEVVAEGRWSDLGEGDELWLVVKPVASALSYPQPGPLVRAGGPSAGTWRGRAYLGEPQAGVGDEFDVVLVAADEEASAALARAHEGHGGLPALPPGAEAADRRLLTRTC